MSNAANTILVSGCNIVKQQNLNICKKNLNKKNVFNFSITETNTKHKLTKLYYSNTCKYIF